MSEKFNLEIISPDQTLLKQEVKQVTLPAYEGLMTILKDHISLVTFLRPGFLEVVEDNKIEKFYVEEGTVEFLNNKLLILSSSVIKLDKLTKNMITKILENSETLLQSPDIQDKDRYILNHKLEALKQIN
ncbi:MAG: ATP synthase F1 subunit epsilon [Proteobacteria bacterium]|jgi:F-type H+-transporting ATPase subunit epsilon|nr:ATP synthase F1 subunit epsilon [Pseudomonadota bacterium]